jgi:hypothetical protein
MTGLVLRRVALSYRTFHTLTVAHVVGILAWLIIVSNLVVVCKKALHHKHISLVISVLTKTFRFAQ